MRDLNVRLLSPRLLNTPEEAEQFGLDGGSRRGKEVPICRQADSFLVAEATVSNDPSCYGTRAR